ncbi:hypothetical protein PR048_018244 [Dryococelus australis]|uniref:Uncharacterized protein n=1 Tax=Dryococelus australis TaxID=614101 RepID=A0ABQ9HBR7_9NEOP|nr:hypothetical protein PR048_018244 [Dryococelus australis]
MGGVRFITPAQNQESMTVNRLLHPPSADTIAARDKLQVNCYKMSALPGLKCINIRELATVSDATDRSVKNAIAAYVLLSSTRCVTLRLGGFHLLVSFMGSIGFIMSGSGIEELWMQVYAKSSVTHSISGHAFSRAVRAHMLISQALITMILGMENLFGVYQEELHKLFLEVSTSEKMISDTVESPVLSYCKLWVQYLRQVDILRLFIRAERSGDWELHLQCVRSMLQCLHAAGHIHYAKSSHLYVQQMEEFPSRMPAHEYNKFTSEDFSIEYDLMSALKTKEGLTRGRGVTESTLAYFLAAFPVCLKLCNALEELSGIKAGSSEQHDESFASGVVGDDSINCDQAEYVGLGAIQLIIGSNFVEVKLTQKNRVEPLSTVARSIFIRDDVIEVNSHQLFMRIVYTMKTENDLKHYLSYELSPRPPAVFDEVAMCKRVKSAFLQLFSHTTPEENSTNDPRKIVIDGGHLLHALVWPCPATYGQIADSYLEFVQKHDRVLVTVVFDGYTIQSTKSQELFRRASKRTFAEIMFEMNTSASTTQADFLSNHHNKKRLITLLSHHFETAGIEVCNSEDDADTLIVKRALELALVGNNVTVIASDSDIVVMLLARATDDMELRVLSPVFNSPESTKEEVCAAGEKFVIALYGRINANSLDELRVIEYTRSIAKQLCRRPLN